MSNVMEMYEMQMDLVAKARKLEKVSGKTIDELIELYSEKTKAEELNKED